VPTIHLLTWNLNKRDAALDAFTRHIASLSNRRESFIAAVQECADEHVDIVARVERLGSAKVHAIGNGTLSVLCSEPLTPMAPPRDAVGNRLVLTRAEFAGRRLAIVNYHGMADGSAGSPHLTERGGIASEARWRIDDHAGGDPVIVLGDFNAEPTSPEIESLYCFSFAPDPAQASGRSHNRDRSILRVFPPRVAPPWDGTYARRSHTRGASFRLLDFFAAGPKLAVVQASVLHVLDGVPLTDGTAPILSDHLPVQGTLDLS
jgi:endonuclease/exonuclease/phosphatase family metal-dependent hydrolase